MDPSNYIILAIIAIIILRRISAMAGAAMGILVAVGVGIFGWGQYGAGNGMRFGTFALDRGVFLGLIVLWLGFEGFAFWRALQHHLATTQKPAADDRGE